MPIIGKKTLFSINISALILLLGLGFYIQPASALDSSYRQVKTADNPAVYFLSHSAKRKKVYVNASAYLGYGHKWSDIKIISPAELSLWPSAKLMRQAGTPQIYYIGGAKKALIESPADLIKYNLAGEPILEANANDLAQYTLASYSEVGLEASASGILDVEAGEVFNDDNNVFLTGTQGNWAGSFVMTALSETTELSGLTLQVKGLYNGDNIEDATVSDGSGNDYPANVSFNKNTRLLTINFYQPLLISPSQAATIRVNLSFRSCNCSSQTVYLELAQASDISVSAQVRGDFPIAGPTFKVNDGASLLGRPSLSEAAVDSGESVISNGKRQLAKFTLAEISGLEDILVKRLVFENLGSANDDDLQDFRLLADGETIASQADMDSRGDIVFDISYLKIFKNSGKELAVTAGLKTGYEPGHTVNLDVKSLWSVGQSYQFSLVPEISNLDQTISLD